MRTPSQTFADEWQAKQYDHCMRLVDQFGLEQSNALFWVVYSGHAPSGWIDKIKNDPISDKNLVMALSLLMCQQASPAKTELLMALIEKLEPNVIENEHMFHRASQANCVESLQLLFKKHPTFNIESVNDKGMTCLGLALKHMRMDTAVLLYKKGASEHTEVRHPRLGNMMSVFQLARTDNASKLEEFKAFHKSALDKSSIEKALDERPSKKGKSKKKM